MNPMSLRTVAALRTAIPALFSSSSQSHLLCPKNLCLVQSSRFLVAAHCPMASSNPTFAAFSTSTINSSSSMEKQFEGFRVHLEESGSVRDRIRAVVMEMESAIRLIHASLLLVHQSLPVPEVSEKARVQIEVLKGIFGRLAQILKECPGQYYRYHGDWRSETQTAVSLIGFLHWLETGNLLMHTEAEEKLGLVALEFGLDVEDYLIGICFMSNELKILRFGRIAERFVTPRPMWNGALSQRPRPQLWIM